MGAMCAGLLLIKTTDWICKPYWLNCLFFRSKCVYWFNVIGENMLLILRCINRILIHLCNYQYNHWNLGGLWNFLIERGDKHEKGGGGCHFSITFLLLSTVQ